MEVYKSIINVLKEVGAIEKKQKNSAQGYQFRGIDDFMNELHGLFAKHQLFVIPHVMDIRREERTNKHGNALIWTISTVRFAFFGSDGSTIDCTTVGEAMDSGDKGANKAMSAALKYALMQVFLVPTEELVDGDKDAPPPIQPKGKDDLGIQGYRDLLQSFGEIFEGKDEAEVCQVLGKIEGFATPSLTARQIIVDMLKDRKVVFAKDGSGCTGLSVDVYTDVSRQFGKARIEICPEVKVA